MSMTTKNEKRRSPKLNSRRYSSPQAWEVFALLRVLGLALAESLWSLLSWPFISRKEDVELHFLPTRQNQALVNGCPALRTFTCSPWVTGPHAQTLFSLFHFGKRPVPRKEVATMPDGVQITLLWFEPENAKPDAPLVVSLHGIAGDENSVRPIMLAEECLKRGWRSVLYVRRGHGNSSLIPVGEMEAGGCKASDQGPAKQGRQPEPPATPPRPSASGFVAVTPVPATGLTPTDATLSPATPFALPGAGPTTPTPTPAAATSSHHHASPSSSPGVDAPSPAIAITLSAEDGSPSASPSSADSFANCLPQHINLPQLSLCTTAMPEPEPRDPETLRRTRKAFPQHADCEDFACVLEHIHRARPEAPMVAVGFSMGSNVLVKYLGEMGAAAAPAGTGAGSHTELQAYRNPLVAAVSVCNGYDIVEGTLHLVNNRPLSDRIITSALHRLLLRRLSEVHAICAAHNILVDFDEVLACNTIREFEAALMLPICGLKDVDQYYQHNNCREAIMNVSIPLLCMSARDDPIIDAGLLRIPLTAAAANPNVLLAVTQRGGHLGWLQGWSASSWMMDAVCQYVQSAVDVAAANGAPGQLAGAGAGAAQGWREKAESAAVGARCAAALSDGEGGGAAAAAPLAAGAAVGGGDGAVSKKAGGVWFPKPLVPVVAAAATEPVATPPPIASPVAPASPVGAAAAAAAADAPVADHPATASLAADF